MTPWPIVMNLIILDRRDSIQYIIVVVNKTTLSGAVTTILPDTMIQKKKKKSPSRRELENVKFHQKMFPNTVMLIVVVECSFSAVYRLVDISFDHLVDWKKQRY